MNKQPINIKITLSDKSEEQRTKIFDKGIKYVFYLLKKIEEEKGILKPV